MERWVNKTAVVTGVSSGIGAAIAVQLANAGITVIGFARRIERVQGLFSSAPSLTEDVIHAQYPLADFYSTLGKKWDNDTCILNPSPHADCELESKVSGSGSIVARKCDISSGEEITAAFEWIENTYGTVCIMINNAGVLYTGGLTEMSNDMVSEQQLVATLDTNVKGTMLCTRHAIASMMKHNVHGHVINVNSIAGHYIPNAPFFNIYTSTKHAITAFTKGLLVEVAQNNRKIKITSLSPGLVHTELGGVSDVEPSIPSLHPEDIANAILYVLSTPPHVNIDELTITSVAEQRL